MSETMTRLQTIESLEAHNDIQAIPSLIAMLDDEEQNVRLEATLLPILQSRVLSPQDLHATLPLCIRGQASGIRAGSRIVDAPTPCARVV